MPITKFLSELIAPCKPDIGSASVLLITCKTAYNKMSVQDAEIDQYYIASASRNDGELVYHLALLQQDITHFINLEPNVIGQWSQTLWFHFLFK